MKALPFFLFIVLVAALVGGIVYLVKKRRQDLQLVARHLKMDFFPKGDNSIAPMLSNLEFFMYGERCNISSSFLSQPRIRVIKV
jgi:hypothetical protein